MTKIGELGEQLVAQWLESHGWLIRHYRWRCRWGEIDLIAQSKLSKVLIFVEVKTRSSGNWDADGLLAVTPQKQAKLWRTAELFIAKHHYLADLPCRFDVALVNYRRSQQLLTEQPKDYSFNQSIRMGEPIFWKGYQFTLQNYIECAFDLQNIN